jgi:hypothetical protein
LEKKENRENGSIRERKKKKKKGRERKKIVKMKEKEKKKNLKRAGLNNFLFYAE